MSDQGHMFEHGSAREVSRKIERPAMDVVESGLTALEAKMPNRKTRVRVDAFLVLKGGRAWPIPSDAKIRLEIVERVVEFDSDRKPISGGSHAD